MATKSTKNRANKRSSPKSAVTSFVTGGMNVVGTQDENQPLTLMQRQYVNFRVHENHTATAAARLAGYKNPDQDGWVNERNPKVIKAIADERALYAEASGVKKKEVIDGFLEAIDMARIKADPISMISGWREVGKMCGFYEPTKSKLEISVNGQVVMHKLSQMSDAELLELAKTPALEGVYEVVEGAEAVDDAAE